MLFKQTSGKSRLLTGGMGIASALALGMTFVPAVRASRPLPQGPPAAQQESRREVATLAAGCFWSMEAIFKQLKGVDKVEPGYSGGTAAKPSYEQVETGTTGHAETINITFNPSVISYRELLRVLFTVRDPTTPNRQGPDEGPQYRSIIFYHNDAQKKVAENAIRDTDASHLWKQPIVTEVKPFTQFYRAENYHLDYFRLHPNEDYCRFVIAPEIDFFQKKFKSELKTQK